ncbi:hypothetical protein AVEN_161864-1 [Araneus ventricosus]|uniref:Sushi domain-containing protein n=1 Tax=Araneus ventricosus TaxID=182803 RepID=A0A4Y2LKX9_ARAVE|nr:hypothetical protein AVEN_161864-1 [Araneus ventricosus]
MCSACLSNIVQATTRRMCFVEGVACMHLVLFISNGCIKTKRIISKTLCDPVVVSVNLSEGEWESDGKTTEYSIGTKRTLKCKRGYHSEGMPLTVACLENGSWTRTSATCKSERHF